MGRRLLREDIARLNGLLVATGIICSRPANLPQAESTEQAEMQRLGKVLALFWFFYDLNSLRRSASLAALRCAAHSPHNNWNDNNNNNHNNVNMNNNRNNNTTTITAIIMIVAVFDRIKLMVAHGRRYFHALLEAHAVDIPIPSSCSEDECVELPLSVLAM